MDSCSSTKRSRQGSDVKFAEDQPKHGRTSFGDAVDELSEVSEVTTDRGVITDFVSEHPAVVDLAEKACLGCCELQQ
jgi:hypothetical protein